MDSENTVRKYVAPGKSLWIIGIIFGIAAAVCGALFVAKFVAPKGEPVLFNSLDDETGSYCFLEIVGVSDWIYQYDSNTYYVAQGSDDYFYVVRLSDSQVKKLSAQRTYWDEETGIPPKTTLTGLARTISRDVRTNMCEVIGLSESRFDDVMGYNYLDVGKKPNEDAAIMFAILTFALMVTTFVLLFSYNKVHQQYVRNMTALGGEYNLNLVAADLEAPTTVRAGKDQLRLGERWLFGRGSGIVLPYEKVLWAYQRVQRTNFIVTGRSLMIGDAEGKIYPAAQFTRGKEQEIVELMQVIARRNPDVLLGYSSDNRRRWKERVDAAKMG